MLRASASAALFGSVAGRVGDVGRRSLEVGCDGCTIVGATPGNGQGSGDCDCANRMFMVVNVPDRARDETFDG